MSGRRREGLAPNLFPFLAVLICTLGTLILLLALVAQNAGDAVAASTSEMPSAAELEKQHRLSEASDEIDRRLSEAKWKREEVVKLRDEQTAEIDERRVRQAHLEDHVRRLRDELKRLEDEVEASNKNVDAADLATEAIEAMKAKIDEEKAKIEKLKEDQNGMAPRIVIVPHKGPNGTDRRPIYIECRANGVFIQPGDVAIDPKYLENNIPGPNPLDAALKTIRLYAMQHYGDVDAPYPLIVVRPDGIETYAAARFAMKGWDDQYGYELVPDEVKLAYPEPDPVMNEQVDKAIAQAVRQQEAYAMGGGGSGAGRGSRGRGGYGEGSVGDPTATNSGASSGIAGAGTAEVPAKTTRRAEDLPILSARSLDAEMAARLESGNYGSRAGSGGSGRSSLPPRQPSSVGSAQGGPSPVQDDAKLAEEAKRLSGNGSTSARFSQNGSSLDDLSSDGTQEPVGSGAMQSSPDRRATSSYASLNSNMPQGAASTSNADKFAPPSEVESKSAQPSASTDPNAPIGGSLASGSSSDVNPAGNQPPPMDPNDLPSENMSPSASMQMNAQKPPGARVKRGGKDWALPSHVSAMTGTAMVRMIRVQCHEDRLVLLPERGIGATNVYGFSDGDINRASLELATAIRDRVDNWGAAMPGAKWHPLMEVDVAPGGEVRYQQLLRLMAGSGVKVEAKGDAK